MVCGVCVEGRVTGFIDLLNLPVYCNLLWDERQAAIDCPKGDIRLALCDRCGAIINTAFDPSKLGYSQAYENSLHYSSRFQAYAQELAERLVRKHQLHNKTIVEIGCGKGDFLVSLCELGNNIGIGFDNSYTERAEHQRLKDKVTFIQDFYSEKYADYRADFVCCRQVLEHIQQPADLLKPLRSTIQPQVGKAQVGKAETAVFFEVPNALHTFKNMMIWDIIYEHCTYFTPLSLTYAFESCGYRTREVAEEFGGQFISIEAYSNSESENATIDAEALAALSQTIGSFKANFLAQKAHWTTTLNQLFQQGKKVVIWGSGSKGVTFLNLLGLQDKIKYAVDINPRKQGKFIPGTGQEIVSPEQIKAYQPDIVIIMNPLYEQEIQTTLRQMNIDAATLTTEKFEVEAV